MRKMMSNNGYIFMRKIIISFFLYNMLLLISCTGNENKINCFKLYISAMDIQENLDTTIFLFLPEYTCSSCNNEIFHVLKRKGINDLNIILLKGTISDSVNVRKILPDSKVFIDRKGLIYDKRFVCLNSYETVLYIINNDKISSYILNGAILNDVLNQIRQ